MTKQTVESVAIYKNMVLVCVYCEICGRHKHRLGYVGINQENSMFGVAYGENGTSGASPDEIYDVHGGITYSDGGYSDDYPIKHDENVWWFGFDCAHAGDTLEICTQEYVENECVRLADQLAATMSDY